MLLLVLFHPALYSVVLVYFLVTLGDRRLLRPTKAPETKKSLLLLVFELAMALHATADRAHLVIAVLRLRPRKPDTWYGIDGSHLTLSLGQLRPVMRWGNRQGR